MTLTKMFRNILKLSKDFSMTRTKDPLARLPSLDADSSEARNTASPKSLLLNIHPFVHQSVQHPEPEAPPILSASEIDTATAAGPGNSVKSRREDMWRC